MTCAIIPADMKQGCSGAMVKASFIMMRQHALQMSLIVRKQAFCICEKKDADQLRSNGEADQRLCFRYSDSTIPLLPKSEMSSLL